MKAEIMVDHIVFKIAHDAAVYCADQRNASLTRARQYRHDLAWFKSHDPAEYEMQMLQNTVQVEVLRAWEYHAHAMNLRRLDRETPKQAALL